MTDELVLNSRLILLRPIVGQMVAPNASSSFRILRLARCVASRPRKESFNSHTDSLTRIEETIPSNQRTPDQDEVVGSSITLRYNHCC
eukprot:COSAG02_NODE_55542_length_290_cov_0.565445_1_plen_87_part_01